MKYIEEHVDEFIERWRMSGDLLRLFMLRFVAEMILDGIRDSDVRKEAKSLTKALQGIENL